MRLNDDKMTDITEVAATGVGEESKADESDTKRRKGSKV